MSAMVPTDFLYWKSTFEDVLYLNGLMDVVESDEILAKEREDGEENPEYKVWQSCNFLVYGWIKTMTGAMGSQLI